MVFVLFLLFFCAPNLKVLSVKRRGGRYRVCCFSIDVLNAKNMDKTCTRACEVRSGVRKSPYREDFSVH